MFVPKAIAVDFETALESGPASHEFYRPDFRVVSCAFSWFGKSETLENHYTQGETATRKVLKHIADQQIPVIVHNIQFEYGVMLNRFPELQLNWAADTMRLVQVADNGGYDAVTKQEASLADQLAEVEGTIEGVKHETGLGLQASISRWLPPQYHNHKEPFHKYLREAHGVKPGKEGANLHLLPDHMLRSYNTADTDSTLLLYNALTTKFKAENYDYTLDHTLYISSARMIAESRGKGIKVDLRALTANLEALDAGIGAIWVGFKERFKTEIRALEDEMFTKYVLSRKSERGQLSTWERAIENPEIYQFNLTSVQQKADLFVGKLGIAPQYFTPKGKPAFGKQFLRQWGPGGEMLAKRGTMLITQVQGENLKRMAALDGRYHVDLRAAGTTTGRFKGTGGLNMQGLARREKPLMECFVADPGHVFVSVDLSAGEPTVTTHFSKDPYYHAATFGMVGKEPYYDEQGVLMIDDIYLMGMSISPMGRHTMRRLFGTKFTKGSKIPLNSDPFTHTNSFPEQWVEDKQRILDQIKAERAFHKILILGLGYSMGPKHMVESAFKAGYSLTLKDARAFFKAYWELFKGVKKLGEYLEATYNRQKYLTNPFGYRLYPEPSYKALNYFIQSSVSGIMHVLNAKFFALAPYCHFTTVIHDELIFQVPEERAAEAKEAMARAVDSLNEDLGWTVKIRTGWVEGKTLYEAK